MATKPKRIEDMSEEELTRRSTEAYDKAMPEPDTTFGPSKVAKESSRYKATLNYPNGPTPRAEIIKDHVAMRKPTFDNLKDAESYASELQRETRGKKKGGAIKMAGGGMTASRRADGIASKGKTRGKMC